MTEIIIDSGRNINGNGHGLANLTGAITIMTRLFYHLSGAAAFIAGLHVGKLPEWCSLSRSDLSRSVAF